MSDATPGQPEGSDPQSASNYERAVTGLEAAIRMLQEAPASEDSAEVSVSTLVEIAQVRALLAVADELRAHRAPTPAG